MHGILPSVLLLFVKILTYFYILNTKSIEVTKYFIFLEVGDDLLGKKD
jgi:hypothetical protein